MISEDDAKEDPVIILVLLSLTVLLHENILTVNISKKTIFASCSITTLPDYVIENDIKSGVYRK